MRPEQLLKPEKPRRGPASPRKSDRGANSGASAGVPLFLKEAQAKRSGPDGSDAFERQADDAARAATSGKIKRSIDTPNPQRATASAIPATAAGSPMHGSIRDRIEPALGADLSHVRVHQADADRAMAGGLGARAFTHGSHIWMGPHESSSDLQLMAHESAHVVQQGATPSAPSIQKQPQAAPAAAGTTDQMVLFVNNPKLETDPSLSTVLSMLGRYKPTVDVAGVDFRVMTAIPSYVGTGLTEKGRSHWEGNKPVIELTQDKYDTIAQHFAGAAAASDVHDVVCTVGHELYHLYREKSHNPANPIQPLFAAEASKRLEQIRQNWVNWARDSGGRKDLGIPQNQTVTKWEDIPAGERTKIEHGASETEEIQGFYERTAYLVEETYVRIEEVSYLRVQQHAETGPKKPSQATVSDIANLIWRFNTALDQTVGNVDFMTPELLATTKKAMLEFLRGRYPHSANPSLDSYEVLFYINASKNAMAPLFDDTGALVSFPPQGARVP